LSPRVRWLIAVFFAAVVFGVLVWFDANMLKNAQQEAAAFFRLANYMWVQAGATVVVAGAVILYAGLAWWARSLVCSIIFFVGGLAELLVLPTVFTFTGDWPLGINLALTWWVTTTSGPLNAAQLLGGALVLAGAIGFYRWAFTRQLALRDA
jgi:hypothetical protein